MFLPQFNFLKETFLKIGPKVAKTFEKKNIVKNFCDRDREIYKELLRKKVIFFSTLSF